MSSGLPRGVLAGNPIIYHWPVRRLPQKRDFQIYLLNRLLSRDFLRFNRYKGRQAVERRIMKPLI